MKGRLLLLLLCSQEVLCGPVAESGHFENETVNNTLRNTLSMNERESLVTGREAPWAETCVFAVRSRIL